jgi:hypothetical protein
VQGVDPLILGCCFALFEIIMYIHLYLFLIKHVLCLVELSNKFLMLKKKVQILILWTSFSWSYYFLWFAVSLRYSKSYNLQAPYIGWFCEQKRFKIWMMIVFLWFWISVILWTTKMVLVCISIYISVNIPHWLLLKWM